MKVGNSIFNAGGSGTSISALGSSVVTSLGYNLSRDGFGGFLTGTGEQINTDPILGPLQNNGGPTLTHAPLSNSPAIDKGKDLGPIGPAYTATGVDQRGSSRPVTYSVSITPPVGGDRSDIGAVELLPGVKPIFAVSRKTHGSAGDFDISLPLTGNPGVECRSGGVNDDYQIILTFATPISFSSAAVTSGIGSVSGTSISGPIQISPDGTTGTQVTIDLTGVTDVQKITVALFDVNNGSNSGDVGIRMGVLVGDTSGNGSVNSSDASQVKSQSGEGVAAGNFREDVNANGLINAADVAQTKIKSGNVLPP